MDSSQSGQGDSTEVSDDYLTRLALAAQRCPPLSEQRQEVLDELAYEVLLPGRLWRPNDDKFNKDIYDDAVGELLLYICEKLEKYDPTRAPFLVWVNMLLHRRFLNLASSTIPKKSNESVLGISELDILLDSLVLSKQTLSLFEEIEEYIRSDPEGIFKKECIKNRPEVNFQFLMQRRLAGYSWKEISTKLGFNVSHLNMFYHRSLKKLAIHIKNYVQQ